MNAQEIVETIATIVASPRIAQYKLGLTLNSPRRRKQYLGVGFEHYVIVDTWLSCDEALEKEQSVFTALTKEAGARSVVYRKYVHTSRDAQTARSLGGKSRDPAEKYDLYVAWWNT